MNRKAQITITAGNGKVKNGVSIFVDLGGKCTDICTGCETYTGEIDVAHLREALKFLPDLALGDPSEYALGESICDPLQDAILSTEMACERAKEGNDVTLRILQKHLMNLHALQIERLREKPEPMFPEYDLRA